MLIFNLITFLYFGFSLKIQTNTLDFRRKSQLQNGVFIFLLCYKHNLSSYRFNLYPVPAPLEDKNTLKPFHISDTLEWCNGTIDIAPEYIFEHGKPVRNENDLPVVAEEPVEYVR